MSDIGFGPVGDPPIIYDTERTDGYGRVTRLVDRRLLEQAQARIAEVGVFARSLLGDQVDGDTPGLDSESEGIVVAHSHLIGRRIQDIIDGKHSPIVVPESRNACSIVDDILERQDGESSHNAARRVVAERDHWKAAYEKATQALPEPAQKLRAAANVLAEYQQHHGAGCANADDLHAEADRLESEATADDVVEKVEDVPADQPWLVKYHNREWWGFRRRLHHRQSEWYLLGITHDGVKFAPDRDVELVSPLGPTSAGLLRGDR